MTEAVFLTQELGPILEFTLNRPETLNAINEEILYGLRAAVDTLQDREDLRILLIRGKGRYFCAGADLSHTPMPDLKNSSSNVRSWYRRGLAGMLALYQEIEACEKPVVVAHHSTCMGGGLELSLSCDFRLAANSASYAFPEANFGSIPATGGVSRLTRYVGPHWARWLIMANKQIDAAQAMNIGLVHAVYPDDEFDAEVLSFCQHLAKQPPEVTAMAKLAIELAADLESAQARNMERLANSVLSLGDEHIGLLAALKARLAGGKKGK